MLKVENLSKYFQETEAVKNVGFEIARGEIVGLVGPTGAGKTTLIHSICTILNPDSGKISHHWPRHVPGSHALLRNCEI